MLSRPVCRPCGLCPAVPADWDFTCIVQLLAFGSWVPRGPQDPIERSPPLFGIFSHLPDHLPPIAHLHTPDTCVDHRPVCASPTGPRPDVRGFAAPLHLASVYTRALRHWPHSPLPSAVDIRLCTIYSASAGGGLGVCFQFSRSHYPINMKIIFNISFP